MGAFDDYARARQVYPHLGLARIQALLDEVGHPERRLSCLHIAGTNGKGSVAVFLDGILRAAGYRVGRYMTPELISPGERVAIGGEPIPDATLTELLRALEAPSERVHERLGEVPSPFEVFTVAAFQYFAREGCDYVVLEAGMGGALDATNVIESPLVSILTRISLDHTAYLGTTLTEIARAKAGIIKEACVTHRTFSAPQCEEVASVLREEAEKRGNTLTFVTPPPPKKHYGMYEAFFYPGYGDIRSGLAGVHQIENACLALAVAQALGVDIFAAQCGVTYARHPGRMEILRERPLLLFDGGHNPDGIAMLTASLGRYLGDAPRTCIYGCMADKDYRTCLRRLAEMPTRFIFTEVSGNPRALPAGALTETAAELGIHGECLPHLADAIARADEIGLPTVIAGSLYLYADLPSSLRGI